MLFKNIHIYRFTKPFTLGIDELEQSWPKPLFNPVDHRKLPVRVGLFPLESMACSNVHCTNDSMMLSLAREGASFHPPSLRKCWMNEFNPLRDDQNRKVRKKEKDELKDQIITELLPKAFKRSQYTQGYIDRKMAG